MRYIFLISLLLSSALNLSAGAAEASFSPSTVSITSRTKADVDYLNTIGFTEVCNQTTNGTSVADICQSLSTMLDEISYWYLAKFEHTCFHRDRTL